MAGARPKVSKTPQAGPSTRSGINNKWFTDSLYRLGEFLRMDDRKMNNLHVKNVTDWDILRNSPEYKCRYVEFKDKRFEKIHKSNAKFVVSDLVHDTSLDNFVNILNEQKIRPGKGTKLGYLGSFPLSWWGIAFEPETDESCKQYMESIKDFMRERGITQGGRDNHHLASPPFAPYSRYGNCRSSMPVDSLITFYEESVGKCQMRVLGTCVYHREVMHAILVHPENLSDKFGDLQKLEDYITTEYPVIEKNDGRWVWCPQSTSSTHPICDGDSKCWDHVTFAFLIPEDRDGIDIPFDELIDKFTVHELWKMNLCSGEGYENWNAAMRELQKKSEKKLCDEQFRKLMERFNQLKKTGHKQIPQKRRKDEYPEQSGPSIVKRPRQK